MRLSPRWLALLPMLCGPALGAQTSLSAGLTAGSAKPTDQRSDQALTGVLLPHATSLLLGGGYDLSQSWRADVSLGIDVGQSDSTQALSRVVGGGATRRFGALAVTLDGSVGLTSGSPKWVVSLGIGTAFGSTSPVAPSAPLRRLKSSFTGGVNRQGGSGKIGCR